MDSTANSQIPNAKNLLEQERAENDARWAMVDVTAPLQVKMHKESWLCWDKYVGSVNGKHVLEVGCGGGLWTVWLASKGANVVAVDLSPVGVAKTIERAQFHGLQNRVRAFCADACHLETVIPADSVDIVLGFSVLHHLPPGQLGPGLRTVLKPGGYAVFFENSDANPLYRLARRIRNSETASGHPLKVKDAFALVRQVGTGECIYPHFKFFEAVPKYLFKNSRLFSASMQALDDTIDKIPGTRRWSAGMWVIARKARNSGQDGSPIPSS